MSIDTVTNDTLVAVELYTIKHGERAATEHFGYAADTIARYRRELIKRGFDFAGLRSAQELIEVFGESTVKTMLRSGSLAEPGGDRHRIDFDGDVIRFIATGDTHFGSKYTYPNRWEAVCERAEIFNADFILHDGDLTEGLSNRAGHIYELSHIGYDAQKQHAIDMLEMAPVPVKIIDGNHDRWFRKSNGALIVKDVAEAVDGVEFLGHDSAYIDIGGLVIMLWHGEDGASYATSYRPQKVIEALRGDELPHIMLAGHTHKMGYFRVRGVHTIATGSIQAQTGWMRSTRKEAHDGFWAVEVIFDGHIKSVTPTWYDFGEMLL